MYRDLPEEYVGMKRVDPLWQECRMLWSFQSNLRYDSSCDHHFVLLRGINNTLCMYILDWNCFHHNVCSFQGLPFSKSFREIRLEGKWVPHSAYSLQLNWLGSLTSHSILFEQGLWDGASRFFYSTKTRKSNRLQMTLKRQHFSLVIERSWLTIGPTIGCQ